jgi:membrane protein YdbS with pleckstrin-like domain
MSKKEKKEKRTVIRTSRKSYIPFYLMIVAVIIILLFIVLTGRPLPRNNLIAAILFIVVIIKLTEVHRLTHHYDITPHSLEKIEGIFLRRIKRMNYGSISQLHLSQNPWEKMLSIGSVEIAQFSETVRTEIKNINKPKEFLNAVSQMMHHKGKYMGGYGG